MSRALPILVFLTLAAGLVGCDQATKHLARRELTGRVVPLVHRVLDLRHVENRDVGFGLLRGIPYPVRRPLLTGLSSAAAAVIVVYWARRRAAGWTLTAGCAVLLAGVVGNLVDRALRGSVTDFVHLHGWPVFNVADACIVAGAALVFLALRRRPAARPG